MKQKKDSTQNSGSSQRKDGSPATESMAASWGRARPLLEEWGVELSAPAYQQLEAYVRLVVAWGKAMNLTGATSVEEVLLDHVLDSLAVVPMLASCGSIVDVGAGAGFPGIPIAIACPSAKLILIEPLQKRGTFLRRAVHELSLGNCEVRETRWEQVSQPIYDGAVSRAVVQPEAWLDVGPRFIHASGRIVVMAGPNAILPMETANLRRTELVAYTLPRGGHHQLATYVRST